MPKIPHSGINRTIYPVLFTEPASFEGTYARSSGVRFLDCQPLRPEKVDSR